MKPKTTYTAEEVAELLAAYRLSDSGTYSTTEVKRTWVNSFAGVKESAKEWLETIALKTIEERASDWWWKVLSKEYRELLKTNHSTLSVVEIYTLTMLK